MSLHLVVLHHGLWGNPNHMDPIINAIRKHSSSTDVLPENAISSPKSKEPEALPKPSEVAESDPLKASDLVFLNIDSSVGMYTYDGIDVCGDRGLVSVMAVLEQHEGRIDRISFIGYSLGGLINRYMIGKLYSTKVFDKVRPVNFITLATPHLGTSHPQSSIMGRGFNYFQQVVLVRVGQQLSLADKFLNGIPLLLLLSDPSLCFFKALALFQKRSVFSNIRNDLTVRYTTAAIASSNPFRRFKPIKVDPKQYPAIVQPSETDPPEKETWKWSEIRILSVFVVLSPIIVPIWLIILSISLSVLSIKARIRKKHFVEDVQWISSEHDSTQSSEAIELQHACSEADKAQPNSELLSTHTAHELAELSLKKKREWMVHTLNTLVWEKVNVCIYFNNAHAAIVMRRGGVHNEHILIYLAKQVFVTK
ncbi:hypothetical protein QVD99_002592 [Batrachochytrium dendrobatidis]|nr:hypothetical protein O5D80_006821 [Batrachochytrium dendrobatidis]KAK5670823.1 hypothetical protein QVD99_002592 [Batrachochytrium dendrobatidis]